MRTTTSIMSRRTTYLAMFGSVVTESGPQIIEGVWVIHVEVMSFRITFLNVNGHVFSCLASLENNKCLSGFKKAKNFIRNC